MNARAARRPSAANTVNETAENDRGCRDGNKTHDATRSVRSSLRLRSAIGVLSLRSVRRGDPHAGRAACSAPRPAVTLPSGAEGRHYAMSSETLQDIRIELESKIAFQEKAITDLNSALVDHTRTIMDLQHRIELLERVVRGLNQQLMALVERPSNEKPPHY